MARKTLAEINENTTRTWNWSDTYTLKDTTQVIRWGEKTHIGHVSLITAELVAHRPGTYKVGDVFSERARCNGNGQHKRGVRFDLDTDQVTCARCIKSMGWDC